MEYKLGEQYIKSYNASEVFLRQGQNPFIMVATSSAGKTYMAVDILYNALKQGYNHINYVTQNYNGSRNQYVRELLPREFVIDDDIFESLSQIFDDAGQSLPSFDEVKTYGKKIITAQQQQKLDVLIDNYLKKLKDGKFNKGVINNVFKQDALAIIDNIFNVEEPLLFSQNLQRQKEVLFATLDVKLQDTIEIIDNSGETQTITKQGFINQWDQYSQKIAFQLQNDMNKYYKIFIMQHIYDSDNNLSELECFHRKSTNCKNPEVHKLLDLIYEPRRLCLVIDDISDFLEQQKTSQKNIYLENREIKENKAADVVINKLFNKGRHLGTIFFAIHSLQSINTKFQNQIRNFVLTPGVQLAQSKSVWVSIGDAKNKIQELLNFLKQYNQLNKTFYVLVCFQDGDQSPDGQQFCFYQAETQTVENKERVFQNCPYLRLLVQGGATDGGATDEEHSSEGYEEEESLL